MVDNSPSETVHIERRDFFRVYDTVLLRSSPIDENSARNNLIPPVFKDDPGFSLMNELQQIDQENSKHLWTIGEHNRELEVFLKGLNKKIDLIAARMLDQDQQPDDQQKAKISISEGGLSFPSNNVYTEDSHLAIQITLLPSHHTMVLFGRIINCARVPNGYSVAVSFVNLKDGDRQLIAKHIMQLQLAQRRQQDHDK